MVNASANLISAKALTFDCYGTLIDWESGILAALQPWLQQHGLAVASHQLLEEYGRAESRIEREQPTLKYSDVLKDVHHSLASTFNIPPDSDAAVRFAQSIRDWPAFPDTVAALRDLKKRLRLIILSNTDHESFAQTQKTLRVPFDALVLAEDVGAYKPDLRMFQQARDAVAGLGIRQDEWVHVAQSLYHDHVPAKSLGLTTVWIDRYRGQQGSGATVPPDGSVQSDYTVASLRELATLFGV